MTIEKITEKVELNVCAQAKKKDDPCLNDCTYWKEANARLDKSCGEAAGCYTTTDKKWTSWW